jgi:hypothetical protein
MPKRTETNKEKAKHLSFLEVLVQQRNSTQELLFELLKLSTYSAEAFKASPDLNAIFQLTVGAAFSLWRAIVLAEIPFSPQAALQDAKELLRRPRLLKLGFVETQEKSG